MKAQEYSEQMHVGGLRARVDIRKVREVDEPRVEFRLSVGQEAPWLVIMKGEAFAHWLLNEISAVEMLVDVEDVARQLIACGCENASGVYRAAIRYALAGWRNRMELEVARHEYDPAAALY